MYTQLDLETKKECEINGKIIPYDCCSTSSLEKAKEFYKESVYIGSSNIYYINGIKNIFSEISHFFVRQ